MPYLTQFKLAGTYPLPWGISLSGSWQGLPGVPVGTARQDAEYVPAQNRMPDPSLNVEYIVTRTQIPNLTVASVTVPLIEPGDAVPRPPEPDRHPPGEERDHQRGSSCRGSSTSSTC